MDAERVAASADKRAAIFQREIELKQAHVLGLHERLMQAEHQVRPEVATDSVPRNVQGEMSRRTALDQAHAASIRAAQAEARADAAESIARDLIKQLATSDEEVRHLRSRLRRYEDPAFGSGHAPLPSPSGPQAVHRAYGSTAPRRVSNYKWEVPEMPVDSARKVESARKPAPPPHSSRRRQQQQPQKQPQPQPQQQPKQAGAGVGEEHFDQRYFHLGASAPSGESAVPDYAVPYGRGASSGLKSTPGSLPCLPSRPAASGQTVRN